MALLVKTHCPCGDILQVPLSEKVYYDLRLSLELGLERGSLKFYFK